MTAHFRNNKTDIKKRKKEKRKRKKEEKKGNAAYNFLAIARHGQMQSDLLFR
jgi:hypothetical protein